MQASEKSVFVTSNRCIGVHTGALFFLDMCVNFHVGFIVTHNFKRRLVTNPREVMKYYMKVGTFRYDLLSAIAWVTQVRTTSHCCRFLNVPEL